MIPPDLAATICHDYPQKETLPMQESYDQLITVVDALIDGFDGGMRIRGMKTALLIQQASQDGRGITVSELARATKAPLENVRRHISKHVELGTLRYISDPDDDRANRVVMTNLHTLEAATAEIARKLGDIDWTNGTESSHNSEI